MEVTKNLQKQLRANPDLSARYKNVASMKNSDTRRKMFQQLLDEQKAANKAAQSSEVTKPAVNE